MYGAVRTSSGTATSKHKFVGSLGHPSDDETGLVYMRARYYDPVVGRFASEDPGSRAPIGLRTAATIRSRELTPQARTGYWTHSSGSVARSLAPPYTMWPRSTVYRRLGGS